MNRQREYFNKRVEMIRKDWFANHRADLLKVSDSWSDRAAPMIYLRWAQPDTGIFLVEYFLYKATLFVTGDIGSATYRWGGAQPLTFEALATFNYDYFAGKHEGLRGYEPSTVWDSKMCASEARDYLSQSPNPPPHDWLYNTESREQWIAFVWQNREAFGDAAPPMFGDVPDPRSIGHWLGIRMAMEQLQQPAASAA